MRRYIYIIGVTAVAMATVLTACSSDAERQAGVGGARVPITLSASVSEASLLRSRAAEGYIEGTAFAQGATIGLYAYCQGGLPTGQDDDATGAQGGGSLSDYTLTADGTTQRFATGRYWPGEDDGVTFVAYYPQQGAGIVNTNDNYGMLSGIGFTMQTAAERQVDLLVSEKTTLALSETGRYGSNDHSGIVPMVFHHALAQIRFYVLMDVAKDGVWYDQEAGKAIDMRIGIDLDGLYQTGTLTVGDDAKANDWGGHTWGGQTGSASVTASDASWFAVTAATFDMDRFNPADYPLSRGEKMLVIPGTYAAGALPAMTLTISDARPIADTNADATLSATLTANDSGRLTLLPGYIYNYYFVVELGKTVEGYFLTPKEAEQW